MKYVYVVLRAPIYPGEREHDVAQSVVTAIEKWLEGGFATEVLDVTIREKVDPLR